MVDEKKIALNPAYELSFLKKEEQRDLLDAMDSEQSTPSLSQALSLIHISPDYTYDLTGAKYLDTGVNLAKNGYYATTQVVKDFGPFPWLPAETTALLPAAAPPMPAPALQPPALPPPAASSPLS